MVKQNSGPDVRVMGNAERLLHFLKHKRGEEALDFYIRLFHSLRLAGCEGLGDWLWGYLRYNETLYSWSTGSSGFSWHFSHMDAKNSPVKVSSSRRAHRSRGRRVRSMMVRP